MRQPRGFDVVEDGDDETRPWLGKTSEGSGEEEEEENKQQKLRRWKRTIRTRWRSREQQQREQQSVVEHGSGVQKFKNDAAAADEHDDSLVVNDAASVFASSTPKLDDGRQSVVFIFVAGERKTAIMTSQSRPTTPTPERTSGMKSSGRGFDSFYVVLKAYTKW